MMQIVQSTVEGAPSSPLSDVSASASRKMLDGIAFVGPIEEVSPALVQDMILDRHVRSIVVDVQIPAMLQASIDACKGWIGNITTEAQRGMNAFLDDFRRRVGDSPFGFDGASSWSSLSGTDPLELWIQNLRGVQRFVADVCDSSRFEMVLSDTQYDAERVTAHEKSRYLSDHIDRYCLGFSLCYRGPGVVLVGPSGEATHVKTNQLCIMKGHGSETVDPRFEAAHRAGVFECIKAGHPVFNLDTAQKHRVPHPVNDAPAYDRRIVVTGALFTVPDFVKHRI